MPTSSWATPRTTSAGVRSGPTAPVVLEVAACVTVRGLVQGEPRAEDREAGSREGQGRGRAGDGHPEPDERRAEDEGRLVGSALVGEGGVDEAVLARSRGGGDGPPPHASQRTDLRQEQTRDRTRDRGHAPRESGGHDDEDADDAEAAPARDWKATTRR